MKKTFVFLSFFLFLQLVIMATVPEPIDDFDVAAKIASIENKDLIVVFSSKDCYYCRLFDSEVYPKADVQTLIKNNYIFTELYLEDNKHKVHFKGREFTNVQFAQAFGIRGTPTFIFFTSTGTPITYLPGYAPDEIFAKVLKYLSQRLFEKGIKFKDYSKKSDTFVGKQAIVELKNKEDARFLLENDPYVRVLKLGNEDRVKGKEIQVKKKDIEKLDPYLRYIVCVNNSSEDLLKLLEKRGFLNLYSVDNCNAL